MSLTQDSERQGQMWQRLYNTRTAIIAISCLLPLLLIAAMLSQLASLSKSLLNSYLIDNSIRIEALRVNVTDLFNTRIPSITLLVNGSQIRLDELQVTLSADWYQAPLAFTNVKAVAIKHIDVSLSEAFLAASNAENPALNRSLDLMALPQIAIGDVTFHIQHHSLGLTLDYLSLDSRGSLTSQLSFRQMPLFSLSASLSPSQWQLSSTLDLGGLYRLSEQLTPLISADNPAAILIAMKQQMIAQGLSIDGKLDSELSLDLRQAQLSSHHWLSAPNITLSKLHGTPLSQPLALRLFDIARQQDGVSVAIDGPLNALEFQLSPTRLSLALSRSQLDQLIPLAHSPLLSSVIEQLSHVNSPVLASSDKPRADDAPSQPSLISDTTGATLILQVGDTQQPSHYWPANNSAQVPRLSLNADVAGSRLYGELTALQLSQAEAHSHPTEAPPMAAKPWELEADWRVDLEVDTTLCLPLNPATTVHSLQASQQDFMQIAQAGLTLTGGIKLRQANAAITGLTLDAAGDAKLINPGFQHQDIKLQAEEIAMELSDPVTLSLDNEAGAELTLAWQRAELNVQGNQFSWTRGAQPSASDKPTGKERPQPSLRSNSTALDISGGQLSFSEGRLNQVNIAPLSITTRSPQLSDFPNSQDAVSAAQIQLSSKQSSQLSAITEAKLLLAPLDITITDVSAQQHLNDLKGRPVTSTVDIKSLSLSSSALSSSLVSHSALSPVRPATEPQTDQPTLLASLLEQTWQWGLEYRLKDLNVRRQSYRFNKLRHSNKLSLSQFNLSQQLQWLARKDQEGYRLSTQESWAVNSLSMSSAHQLDLNRQRQPQQLEGQFTLAADANALIEQVETLTHTNYGALLIGDASVKGKHQLHWRDQGTSLALNFTPQLALSEGSLNNFPFKQAKVTAQCQFAASRNRDTQIDGRLGCDSIKLNIAAFNPGVVLSDIQTRASFTLDGSLAADGNQPKGLTDAVIAVDGHADTLGGKILLPIFDLNLTRPSSAYLVLQGLDIEQLLAVQPVSGIYADGIFDGVLPVKLIDGKVSIIDGRLAARTPGGLIKVDDNPAVMQMRLSQPYLDFAFSALEELHYTQLSSSFDMDSKGDALLKVNVKGRAKDIERPIHLNYAQEENMLQLLKSLQIGDTLQSEIERAMAL